ncbi:MAG: T9SS type A sorting domain-containing protein, partial [Bacteroidales bacterium]|nr:T9SS type A sorting domain-containing protein [Bacteroidales bacterium]
FIVYHDHNKDTYYPGNTFPLNQDYTFTAQWRAATPTGKVKVTLDLNGGTFKNADDEALWTKEISTDGYYYMAIQEGYPLSLPELVPPTDKFFEGYLDQNSDRYEVNTPYNIYGNIDFVADWCSNQVTLTWKCDNWETGTTNTFVLNSAVKDYPQLTISGTPEGAEIHYSSSDPAVAIIRDNGEIVPYMAGETTITAMFDGEGDYCSAETSYTLVVECNEPTPVIEGVGDLSGCNTTIMLRVRQKNAEGTISDYPAEGFSFQWYKDDKAIEGATQVTYTVQTVGDYFVVVHKFCYAQSENTAHITTSQAEPEVVRLAPFQFYRPKHTYPAEQATRHLFSYKSADTDASKCALTAARKRSGEQPADIAEADLRTFIAVSATPDSRGYYTVTADLNSVPTSLGLQAGDTLVLTLTPFDNCGSLSTAYAEQIDIRIVSKPALAFIISGADQLTRDKAKFKLHGDFLTGINRADLYKQSAKNWKDADLNTPLPLYTAIQKEFEVVPVNGYADFNLYNYEPFDILLLTDFVRTGIGSKGSTIVTVIDSLAKLVDYRPMFSLKAHMAKKEFPTWKTKGFIANPAKPAVNPQKDMTVLCLAHNIFEGLPEYKGTAVPTPEQQYQNNIIYTADGNIVVRITSEGGFDDGKALQGFEAVDATNFVNIGIIPSGKNNGTLIACCERQANINARLLILSVNADATCKLTPIGCQAIIKGLNYLLETDPVKVSDCSVTFHNENGKGDHLWTTPTNWSTGRVPLKEQNIQIAANCIVNTPEATAATVKIIADSTLTIQPKGALTVNGQIWTIPSETDKHNTSEITDPSMITILSDASGVGALVRAAGDDARLAATVQMYSKAYFEWVDGKRKKYWQYVGVPIQTAAVPECFYGAYTYLWEEANGWTRKSDGTILEQFKGYGLSVGNQENTKLTYTLRGDLATSDNRNITLTINNSNENYRGTNMIGNSWTAPIHIDKMLATDFGTANATVYIYNTGRDDQQTAATSTVTGDVDATQPGQWIAITPGLAAQSDYAGLKVIPAMQAFDILTESETSLYLDYERVVRGGGTADINTPMRAPQSNKSGNGITLMRVTVADSQTHTDLYLMQHQAFTDAFDNGWDATYMACDGRSASLYAITPIGEMAVAAIPEIEGINLGFAPGKETEYTFSFGYTGSMLYLNDTRERRSTLITDWNTYRFTASDNDDANRFYISATPIEAQVPSGLVEVSDNHGVLTLSNPAHENLSICLYDAAGRLCATTSTADAMTDITLPATQGVYLLRVSGENTHIVRKLTR